MHRLTLCLVCAGLSTPAFAQDLNPAIEGAGDQTQSVELFDSAVSVSVESSGSVSLNRGNDSVDGALGVSVNDTTILGVSTPSNGPQGATVPPSTGTRPVAAPQSAANSQNGVGTVTAPNHAVDCQAPASDHDSLSQALAQGFPIMARQIDCSPAADLSQLISLSPTLQSALSRAGIPGNRVVSITISSDAVIVDYAS